MKKTFAILSLLFVFLGCNSNKDTTNQELEAFDSEEYAQVLEDLNRALQDKNRGIAFDDYARKDDYKLESALETAQGGLLSLVNGTDLYSAYVRLGTSIKTLDEIIILDRDQERIDSIFSEVRLIYNKVAKKLGKSELAEWNIYNYNFGAGFEPEFTDYASNNFRWGYNVLIDIPKAQIGGRKGTNSWLVSKTFDLSNITNPSFRFLTVLNVDSLDATINRKFVIENTFKVYVILNPNPLEDYSRLQQLDKERFIQIRYSVDDMPLGERFHKKWVPSRDLSQYKNTPIAIAFRFDAIDEGYHMWQLYDFEINGAGQSFGELSSAKVLFNKQTLPVGYHSASLGKAGSSIWSMGQGGGNTFAVAERGTEADTWLLSPRYFISEEVKNPTLNVSQTFNIDSFEQNAFDKMNILVSANYKGGNPSEALWDKLDYSASLYGQGNQTWNTVLTQDLDLTPYIGKELVVAFRYQSQASDQHTWQLNGLYLKGQGGTITPLKYSLDCFIESPFEKDIIYTYDLDIFSLSDTRTDNIEGEPASWRTEDSSAGSCFPKTHLFITGFSNGSTKVGSTRKILPEVDLSQITKASFRTLHSLDYPGSPKSTVIEISEVGSSLWEEIPHATLSDRGDNIYSEWISIPEQYMGKKVQFAVKYSAFEENGNASRPNFSFKRLEVKEDSE